MKIRKQQIEFNEDGHTYVYGGELFTGVTTVLGVRQKDFLKWWTAKLCASTIQGLWQPDKAYTKEEIEKICLEGKKAHTVKSKEALTSGKTAHEWIENYINAKIKGWEPEMLLPEDKSACESIKAFLDWESKHEVEWLYSELVVADPINKYAGTLDFIAKVDGKNTLGDFKTSSQISEDYYLQTAAYQNCIEPLIENGEKVEQRMILRIPKDGSSFEAQVVPTDYNFDLKTFLALREVHRWNVYIENNLDKLLTNKQQVLIK